MLVENAYRDSFFPPTELNSQLLQRINTMEKKQDELMKINGRLQAVLFKNVDEDDRQAIFEARCHEQEESLEDFCQKLTEDKAYKDLFVSSWFMFL